MKNILQHGLLISISLLLFSCESEEDRQYYFDQPTHAVFGKDNLIYISDGYANSRIAVFDVQGRFIRAWGSKGYAASQFNTPHGLTLLSDGSVVVCDRDNARIQKFSSQGVFLEQWFGQQLGRPWNIAVGNQDTMFVLDGGDQDPANPRSAIIKLDPSGKVVGRYSMFGNQVGELNWAHAIAVNSRHELFVVDLRNERVQKFIPRENTFIPDSAWIQNAQRFIAEPVATAVLAGEVFVSQDGKGKPIVVLNEETGEKIREIGIGTFERIHGLSADAEGTLWAVDEDANAVYRISKQGDILLKIGGK